MDFRPKSFRTIFEKRTPVYSFAAPLLGLAKSIYYFGFVLHACSCLWIDNDRQCESNACFNTVSYVVIIFSSNGTQGTKKKTFLLD